MTKPVRIALALLLLSFGMAIPVCASTLSTDNANATGWYISAAIILVLLGYAIRFLFDFNLCKKCGMSEVKTKMEGIEWLLVKVCEKNGIDVEERKKYLSQMIR